MINRRLISGYITVLFFVLVISACNEEQPLVYKVSVEIEDVAFSFEKSIQEVKLKSNYKWSVSQKPEWISVSPDHGEKGEYVLRLECVPNPSEEERIGILKITCGDEIRTLEMTQERLHHLKFNTADTLLMEEQTDLSLLLTADVPYEVIFPENCRWISKKTINNGSLVLSVARLDMNAQREAEIIIKAVDYRLSDTLRILQVSNDYYTRKILGKFYDSMDGEHWRNNTNWLSDKPLEEWYGIQLDGAGNIMLHLNSNNLSGEIPPELYKLQNLLLLNLGWNKVKGSLLPAISNWKNMFSLDLMATEISGQIPDELWALPQLNGLTIGSRNLEPLTIDYLALSHTRIANLCLYGMKINNGIPPEVGLLKNLRNFSLTETQITGTLPLELFTLPALELLELSGNHIEGNIPPEIGKLSRLVSLYLRENRLTGKVPDELWKLTNLNTLAIGDNFFETWSIPEDIGNMIYLRVFNAPNSNLTGSFPKEIWQLSDLESLSVGQNTMSGMLPPEVGNLINLTQLAIGGNNFTGTIPEELGRLKLLRELIICNNYFTGKIPRSVTGLPNWPNFNPYSLYSQKDGTSLEPEF